MKLANVESAVGIGAGEIARRALSDGEIRSVIRGEINERRDAAEQFARSGHTDRAAELRDAAEVLAGLLSDV